MKSGTPPFDAASKYLPTAQIALDCEIIRPFYGSFRKHARSLRRRRTVAPTSDAKIAWIFLSDRLKSTGNRFRMMSLHYWRSFIGLDSNANLIWHFSQFIWRAQTTVLSRSYEHTLRLRYGNYELLSRRYFGPYG